MLTTRVHYLRDILKSRRPTVVFWVCVQRLVGAGADPGFGRWNQALDAAKSYPKVESLPGSKTRFNAVGPLSACLTIGHGCCVCDLVVAVVDVEQASRRYSGSAPGRPWRFETREFFEFLKKKGARRNRSVFRKTDKNPDFCLPFPTLLWLVFASCVATKTTTLPQLKRDL